MQSQILSKKEASLFCGISIPTIQRLINKGDFAPKLQLSARRVGFFKHDLQAWLASRTPNNHEAN